MKINYYKNGDTTIAHGYKETYGPQGVPEDVYFSTLASDKLSSTERSILLSDSDFKSTSTPRGTDQFNEEIGKEIARDKVIVKNCKREKKQLDIIKNYLENQLKNVNARIEAPKKKQLNAKARLDYRSGKLQ